MRKIIIGLIAAVFVALMFLGYAFIMDTTPIQTPTAVDVQDVDMPESQGTGLRAGDTDVRDVRDAQYFVFDENTNQKTRVFGFKRMLNPGMETSRWRVESPYLIFYETDYECRVDSDQGIFQVKKNGSSEVPKDAQLKGNVVIHLMPKSGSGMSETRIEMDDLTFSSERSEFATDGPVRIHSDEIELEGYGLILLFDTAVGRIDYLHIRDLEVLRIVNVPESQNATVAKAPAISGKGNALETTSAQPPETTLQATEDTVDAPVPEKAVSPSDYYECILDENVEIAYGDKIVVSGADQVRIQNILFSRLDDNREDDNAADSDTPDIAKPKQAKPPLERSDKTIRSADPATEVVVHCDGGIILRPKQAQEAVDSASVVKSEPPSDSPVPVFSNTVSEGTWEAPANPDNQPPAKFEAWKIDYDLQTGTGLAHGPVRVTYYQPTDPNSTTPAPWKPVMVTADEDAQFIADPSRAITQVLLNKNVLAVRLSQQPEFTQLDKFHGDKLSIFFDKNKEGATDVSGIRMTEGKVYAQSRRFKDEQTLSNVRLSCSEIKYDRATDEIVAKGPNGEIQLDNSHTPDTATSNESTGIDTSKPCYVFAEGFDTIQWDLGKEKIVVDGQQDQLKLSYVPLLDGLPEKYVYVDSVQFILSFMTSQATGKTDLKSVYTDKAFNYTEKDRNNDKTIHTITGQTLNYDTVDTNGWVKIEGTPAMPVNMDNARVPYVYIHPLTGKVETSISNIPGILRVP